MPINELVIILIAFLTIALIAFWLGLNLGAKHAKKIGKVSKW